MTTTEGVECTFESLAVGATFIDPAVPGDIMVKTLQAVPGRNGEYRGIKSGIRYSAGRKKKVRRQ